MHWKLGHTQDGSYTSISSICRGERITIGKSKVSLGCIGHKAFLDEFSYLWAKVDAHMMIRLSTDKATPIIAARREGERQTGDLSPDCCCWALMAIVSCSICLMRSSIRGEFTGSLTFTTGMVSSEFAFLKDIFFFLDGGGVGALEVSRFLSSSDSSSELSELPFYSS